ncbi:MAG TPA: DNA adenine methylase [Methylophilaceae bacterium]|nr:DNA adenine methylase [Methylophilaceae bacterium]
MQALPVIPWIGGKRRLAAQLIPLFPPHSCYVEVFCGGAALYFLRPVPAETEIINDINGDLVRLYKVLKHHLQEFVRQFEFALSSRQIFEWEKMTRPETLTDIQRAARFYYMQHHAFGAKVTGQNFGTVTTGEAAGLNICRIEQNLTAAWMRLGGTCIENLAWRDCVDRYDRPHTFFYMDPPYWETEGYGVPFEFDNYVDMAAKLRSMKGKAMISINDHPAIREVFAGLPMLELDIRYNLQNGGESRTSGELVITNWETAEMDMFSK